MKIDILKEFIEEEIIGNVELEFDNVKTLEDCNESSLVWLKSSKDREKILKNIKSNIVVIGEDYEPSEKELLERCFILSENPKLTFIRIVKKFFVPDNKVGICHTTKIDNVEEMGNNCYIGPNVYLGRCKLGDNVKIHGNCFIYDNVAIGDNVTISAGAVIGSVGYGYSRNENGEFESFPHIGGVIIGNNVDIGSNTCIDRGSLGNTIIKEGSKIDNLVHIAHNVVIGKHCAIIANSMIGGSVVIGDYSWVAPSASIINQVSLGYGSTIGMSAVVVKDVKDNETVAGSPARNMEKFIRIQKHLKNI